MPSPQSLLTRREAADRLRLHPTTLSALTSAGRGPAVTVLGGKHLFSESALEAWIQANTRQPKPVSVAA